MYRTKIQYFAVFILSFVVFACGSSTTTTTEKEKTTTGTDTKTQNNPGAKKMSVKDKNGAVLVDFDISSSEIVIKYGNGEVITGHLKGEKTKYMNSKGDVVVEVKHKDEGFKLKSSDEKLLWKVKLGEDKIKLSDNEENANPYEIKKKDAEKYKVEYQDKEIGKTKFENNVVDVDGIATDLKIPATNNQYAYGMLLLRDIPERDRYIIMAELLVKNL